MMVFIGYLDTFIPSICLICHYISFFPRNHDPHDTHVVIWIYMVYRYILLSIFIGDIF